MSDEIVIRIENLGKRYRIQHRAERQRYTALRDVIAHKLKAPFQFLRRSQKSEVRSQTSDLRPPTSARSSSEDFWALRDVSFEVRQGEVVGIIGRNGAGKSTLLKILSRITEPTTGRVRILGRVASLLEVGTGFHPELTGRENIFLNGAILGMHRAEIKRKFDEIVAFAEVEKFLDTPVKRYSSGMYVRLAFAVAAHLEPEILIVDEVLAVGDAQFQKKCLGKMQSVATKEGRTVLFVSHNMVAIRSLCSRAILLRAGCKIAGAPTDDVLNIYQNQDFNEALHRKWDAPRIDELQLNHGMYLKEAKILLEVSDNDMIHVNTPFSLAFCVHSRRECEINLSPHYLGTGGEVIFAAPSPQRKLQVGDNWFTCRMPANFLNDGVYSVQLMIVEDCAANQMVNEALVFEVHDVPRDGNWHGKWPGVVRPLLEWQLCQPKPDAEVCP